MSPKEQRPAVVPCKTVTADCGCNKMFAILGGWGGSVKEVFVKLGPQGSCAAAIVNALAVLISVSLRSGVPANLIGKLFANDSSLCHTCGANPTCINALGEILLENSVAAETDLVYSVPMSMTGSEQTKFSGCGLLSVQCFDDREGNIRKVGAELAQTNTCANTITKMVGKLITLALCHGVAIEDIVKGLRDITCPQARQECSSCLDAIARAIETHENRKRGEGEAAPETEEA